MSWCGWWVRGLGVAKRGGGDEVWLVVVNGVDDG
jgi:hypothetical protein